MTCTSLHYEQSSTHNWLMLLPLIPKCFSYSIIYSLGWQGDSTREWCTIFLYMFFRILYIKRVLDDVCLSNRRPLNNQSTSSDLVALYRYLEFPWRHMLTLCKYAMREVQIKMTPNSRWFRNKRIMMKRDVTYTLFPFTSIRQ